MDKSLVTKATSPDEVPTAGYMFNEIARITQASADDCKVRFEPPHCLRLVLIHLRLTFCASAHASRDRARSSSFCAEAGGFFAETF